MQAVISKQQQTQLLRLAGQMRLSRHKLGDRLNISHPTLQRVLDNEAPVVVSGKTFTAVNDFLISELSK